MYRINVQRMCKECEKRMCRFTIINLKMHIRLTYNVNLQNRLQIHILCKMHISTPNTIFQLPINMPKNHMLSPYSNASILHRNRKTVSTISYAVIRGKYPKEKESPQYPSTWRTLQIGVAVDQYSDVCQWEDQQLDVCPWDDQRPDVCHWS
jgi:hypothetical protein